MTALANSPTEIATVPLQLVRGQLVASVQVDLNDDILRAFQQDLLETLQRTRAHAVILDLSGIDILDSLDFRSVLRTLMMARLMSAVPVIVGLRAGVAASLAELGVSAEEIASCLTLEQAFEMLDREGLAGRLHHP